MVIYPIVSRRGSIKRIEPQELVSAVLLMATNAKKNDCKTIFFPEIGGLPLKYIYQHSILKQEYCNIHTFSSKVTAINKSPLGKQICSMLTVKERDQCLTDAQVVSLLEAIGDLPQVSKKKLMQVLNINQLDSYRLGEIVSLVSGIGLHIPSEDKSNWIKDGVITNVYDVRSYSPEDNSFFEFQDFRKRVITYGIARMSDIIHDTRPLLNVILSGTRFAKMSKKGMIYVMDEAISRGRTLSTLDIIFKAFNRSATWKIGVLFCPLDFPDHEKIDFIFSNKCVPQFSNRFDLIGEILVESETEFVRYNIEQMLAKGQKAIHKYRRKTTEYLRRIRLFVHNTLFSFIEINIIDENDLVRLLHFTFVCNDHEVIKRCIDLNPTKIEGIIEEVSFYINMIHPLDPIPMRKRYKNNVLNALGYIETISENSPTGCILNKLKSDFCDIRKDYELLELKCWVDRHREFKSQLNNVLTDKQDI